MDFSAVSVDHAYQMLIHDVLKNGTPRNDRTGTGTLAVFGRCMRFDLRDGFPLLSLRRVTFRLISAEMCWFLSGSQSIHDLDRLNNLGYGETKFNGTIWDEWADKDGNLGPIYGVQWRKWFKNYATEGETPFYDQIREAEKLIKTDPYSRRIRVSAWNVGELEFMALPPCHTDFQIFINPRDKTLSLSYSQRSVDIGLGLPFNIAQYALLTHMFAAVHGYTAKDLVVNLVGDVHIYENHREALTELLIREPRQMPVLRLLRVPESVIGFIPADFHLEGYNPHSRLDMEVSK